MNSNYQKGATYISPFYLNISKIKIDNTNSIIKGYDPNIKAKIIYIRSDGNLDIDNTSNNFKPRGIWYDYIPIIGIYSDKWIPLLTKYEWNFRNIDLKQKKYFSPSDIYDEIKNKDPKDYYFLNTNKNIIKKLKNIRINIDILIMKTKKN